jgi:hypothetical protein
MMLQEMGSKFIKYKCMFWIFFGKFLHRRIAWSVQKGRRRPQAVCPAGGPPLKQLQGRFRGGPPTGCRRVGHGTMNLNRVKASEFWNKLSKSLCAHPKIAKVRNNLMDFYLIILKSELI